MNFTKGHIGESQYQILDVLQASMDGFWLVDMKGKILDVNEAACKISGYAYEELLQLNVSDLEVIENADQTHKHIQKVVETGHDRFESKHRCKNGEVIDVELSGNYLLSKQLISVFLRDITEHLQNEKRIASLLERLSLSQESSNAGTWDWDIQNNNFYWSKEFLKLFEIEPGAVPGFEAWKERLHPDDIEAASIRIQEAIDEKKDLLQHYRIILPGGNLLWIRAIGRTIFENDLAVRMIGLCIDVTDQMLAEQEIQKKVDELERFHKLVIGRELRMIELKNEINELAKQLGEDKDRYLTSY